MPLEIRILSGARAGQTARFEKAAIAVGRLDASDLKFDPTKDLDVSGRHAEFRSVGGGNWEVGDAGSTNGTYVNGAKITGAVVLKNGDRVKFGGQGPEVEVVIRASSAVKAGSTEERVAFAVKKQTEGLRKLMMTGIAIVVVGLVAAYWIGQRTSSEQVARLQQQLQDNDARIRALQNGIPGDTALVNELQRNMAALRERLKGATTDGERQKISDAIRDLETKYSGLTRMDLASINTKNAPAVAIIVSMIGGHAFAGTAFAITPQGVLLTNRHNVRSLDGKDTVTKIAVKFRDTREWLPAHVVRISESEDVDLAIIEMDKPGPYPTITGIHSKDDDAHEGASVAIIGFPYGYETAQEGDGNDFMAKSTLNGGTVSKRTTAVLQVDSFAGHGSSGSPVLSAHGAVVGVVYGGQAEAGGRIVYAVPPDRIAAFLGPDYKSILKD